MTPDTEPLVTPEEFASALNLRPKTFAALRRRDPLFPTPIRLSNRLLRWRAGAVEQYLKLKSERGNDNTNENQDG